MKRSVHGKRRCFTLVELMSAMAVLIILMGMLFHVIARTQTLTSTADATRDIHERARVVFDLVQRDLQCMMVSSVPDELVAFRVWDRAADARKRVCTVVTATRQAEQEGCRLIEVSYSFSTGGSYPNTIRRKEVDESSADWDFYGRPTSPAWYENTSPGSSFQQVVGGVADFAITFYDAAGDPYDDGSPPADGRDHVTMPKYVRIELELYDLRKEDMVPAVRDRTTRRFSRIIYLGRQDA